MSMPPPPPPPEPPLDTNPRRLEVNTPPMMYEMEASGFTVLMNIINSITHWVLGGIAVSAFMYANISGGPDHLWQHVYLNVIGYIILMSTAVLSYNPNSGWASNLAYPTKRVIHWVFQVIGSGLAITGSFIRISKIHRNLFTTAHGILGLVALILTIISLVSGLCNLILPSMMKTKMHRTFHSFLGILTLTIAFITLCYGFNTDVYRGDIGDLNADMSIAFTVIALVGTLMSACGTMVNRLLTSESEKYR